MNRRIVVGTMVMAASLFASEAVYAAPAAVHVPVNAMFGKTKMVSFALRNASASPIKVKAGAQEMTLAPGAEATPIKLALGEKVVAVDTTPNYAAGTVLAVASSELSDTTVVLR